MGHSLTTFPNVDFCQYERKVSISVSFVVRLVNHS